MPPDRSTATTRPVRGRAESRPGPRQLAPQVRPLPHLLTIEQIAEHLGVTVRHVRRLVAERRIPYLKWGHLLRFDPADIAEWLETSRSATWSP